MSTAYRKRACVAAIYLGCLLGVPLTASAAVHDKGGGGGGGSPGGGAGGGGSGGGGVRDSSESWGYEGAPREKKWFVEGAYEFHRLVRQNDLGPNERNKNFNYWVFGGGYDFTVDDHLEALIAVYQRFIKNEGETGARFDDAYIRYRRFFQEVLPRTRFEVQPRVTIPMAFSSAKLQGMILIPRLTLAVQHVYKMLRVELRGYGEYYIASYTSSVGSNPNPRTLLAAVLDTEVYMPFHKPLSFGLYVYTARTGFYNVSDGGSVTQPGTTSDGVFDGQPHNGSYGGEIYARYVLPAMVKNLSTYMRVAYANGDHAVGYQPLLHDGVGRYNAFYRHNSEFYLSLHGLY